jgi:hypothetical protein
VHPVLSRLAAQVNRALAVVKAAGPIGRHRRGGRQRRKSRSSQGCRRRGNSTRPGVHERIRGVDRTFDAGSGYGGGGRGSEELLCSRGERGGTDETRELGCPWGGGRRTRHRGGKGERGRVVGQGRS